ncbi:MBOAT family protein [Undibacterium sp. CY18W]|uniref:Probable alginate O-acetylase AlgI n=1 Tax=Undibacterium hunanense TaxID=2762292 RepID=A0ABR6ZWN7_9BURK|nr:MBOAT family protein [Undibacterium hunanense]MBC3920299.1 MBOAT family protein [Undibacterium hunanense]
MLFNSFGFLFAFLPVTLAVWLFLQKRAGLRIALSWLVIASLFFYAVWDVRYLAVLLTSISINFWLGGRILHARQQAAEARAGLWLKLGIGFNLLVLGGFKYTYFLAANLFGLFQAAPPFDPIVLPLAISFVTFQKIAYLVDCRRGQVQRHDALDYLFFVSFFPQLIAGPIVHHKPLIAQANTDSNPLFSQKEALVTGFSFLALGLFKKTILADSLARYASPVFELAKQATPGGEAAWQAMLAYTLQLYFDFSAYSDMAIGLALMFGFKLPVNFFSPYKATSIIDFWRRWHMTLSSFLRDYLYIPLGGNRHGEFKRYRNLWLTMLLAGIWHGAGWNFMLWGALHGSMLLINHFWHHLLKSRPTLAKAWQTLPDAIMTVLTFLLVAFAWILFRANDMNSAWHMYAALLQPFSGNPMPALPWHAPAQLAEGLLSASPDLAWAWIGIGLLTVWCLPNSVQLLSYDANANVRLKTIGARMQIALGIGCGTCFWLALKWMAVRPATEFLYFNF